MENTFDAIVVGTGISGGWAAKELTEKGLKTLVLERGRMINHIDDYHTANMIHGTSKGVTLSLKMPIKDNQSKVEQDM